MVLRVRGMPRLHPQYGFSVTITNVQPEGEGTIRRAAELLQSKLQAEGLFAPERKRPLPYPPQSIGLITSTESAAYADFVKVLGARWRGIDITCVDVQVQGEAAPGQIVAAIDYFNGLADPPDVLVLTRGGGSPEDLFAFNTEQVTRAVAASRVPTLVAIGHEVDISMAELAADQRASTPSNAAELLVPHRDEIVRQLQYDAHRLQESLLARIRTGRQQLGQYEAQLDHVLHLSLARAQERLESAQLLLAALNPRAIMTRGYAIVRLAGKAVANQSDVHSGDIVNVELSDGRFDATVQ